MAQQDSPHPPPPPPPPPGGPHQHPHPPPPRPFSFFDMFPGMADAPGAGVDHATGPEQPWANMPGGFAFGPGGFAGGWGGWGGPRGRRSWGHGGPHHHPPPPPPPPPPPGAWGEWGHGPWGGPWGGPEGRRRRGHGGWRWMSDSEDENDENWPSGDEKEAEKKAKAKADEKAGAAAAAAAEDDESTMRATPTHTDESGGEDNGEDGEFPDPPEEEPQVPGSRPHGPCHGRRGRRGHCGGGGRGRGFGFGPRRHHHPHHGPRGSWGRPPMPGMFPFGGGPHHHPHPPPPGPPPPGPHPPPPFNFQAMWEALSQGPAGQAVAAHPLGRMCKPYIQALRNSMQQQQQQQHQEAGQGESQQQQQQEEGIVDKFVPPVDIFATPTGWTLHVALPGASKDDVVVSWDARRGTLSIAGVVHRPAGVRAGAAEGTDDDEFLRGLVRAERRVGAFERVVELPPREEKKKNKMEEKEEEGEVLGEVDGEGITAKMENGVLVVKVPRKEAEWTEVRRVDVE